MIAVILAGGRGTRLSSVTNNEIPKPMALFCGKPILEHTIERFKENGVTKFIFTVGFLSEKIIDYFKDGSDFGVDITYIIEEEPLGSAGALYYAKNKIKNTFIVCSGDVIFDINVSRMLDYHKQKNAHLTMFTHPNLHPYDSDLVISDTDGKVTDLDLKGKERNYYYANNVNAGFFIIDSSCLSFFDSLKKVNMEKDFVCWLLKNDYNVYAYKSPEYIKDVGTAERFEKSINDYTSKRVNLKNLKNPQKAIFLDRDGTINKYKGFITHHNQIELVDDAIEAIGLINDSEYLAIVITNQPVIARGDATFNDVHDMHNKIETLLGKGGAYLDEFYYCPHHPHSGFEGEVKALKIECDCRKPSTALMERAAKQFNLDLDNCYIIGDSYRDIQAGINLNIKTIKVPSTVIETTQVLADFEAQSLLEAVEHIIKK